MTSQGQNPSLNTQSCIKRHFCSTFIFLFLAFSHVYVSRLFSADATVQKQSKPLAGILSTGFAAQAAQNAEIPYHQNFLNAGLGV